MARIQPELTSAVNYWSWIPAIYAELRLVCATRMVEPRVLPHLAEACRTLLGDTDATPIPPSTRAAIAAKAGVGEETVKRFLRGERVPRSGDLDRMVTSIAAVADADWWEPWTLATE